MLAGFGPTILAGLIVAVGACLQGSTGLGLALLAVPLLASIDTRLVPVPIIVAGLVLLILMSIRERAAVNLNEVGWSIIGSVPGTIAGALIVAVLTKTTIITVCSVLILIAVVTSGTGWAPPFTKITLVQAGAASGFMGTVSSAAGPPMALLYQRKSGAELRATLSTFFIIESVLALTSLFLFGQIHRFQLEASAVLVPFTVAGFLASAPAKSLLDHGYIRPMILIVCATSAIVLLMRTLT